jgi:hypothetical protein
MNGKIIAITIIAITALFAAGLWYAQTQAYFTPLEAAELVVTTASGDSMPLVHRDFSGIDSASSPLRFRGCFQLDAEALAVLAGAMTHPDPTPLIAPDWFLALTRAPSGRRLKMGQRAPCCRCMRSIAVWTA